MSTSHMLIRRTALEHAWRDQAMPDGVSPDMFVNVRIAVAAWWHVLVDAPLVLSRWHAAQLSRTSEALDLPIATLRALRIDDPALSEARNRVLAHAYLARGLGRIASGERRVALEDCTAAANASPAAWALTRRLLALAALSGSAGSMATRGALVLMPRGQHRTRPPRAIAPSAR